MRLHAPRYAVLFFFALALPCLLLVAVGARMIRDGDELAAKRQVEEQTRAVERIGDALMTRLESIRIEEAAAQAARPATALGTGPRRDEVALVGWIRDGRLILPWDVDPTPARFAAMIRTTSGPFAQALTVGGRFETLLQFANAEASYAQATASAANAIETDYADFLRARVQVKCDCGDAARPVYERLLASDTIDDEGVPLELYAARQLLDLRAARAQVLAVMERTVAARRWASPAAIHLEKAIVDLLAADPADPDVQASAAKLRPSIERRLADEELALKLQRDSSASLVAALAARPGGESVWQPIDQAQWLMNVSTSSANLPPVVIAVRLPAVAALLDGQTLSATVQPGTLRFASSASPMLAMGDRFPGLRVAFEPKDAEASMAAWGVQRAFYFAGLAIVIGVTGLGGLFVWRNVRRELRLAELRAQFVASVSHELKTPLTAIRMFAETLQMERPLDLAGRAEYLDTIVNESERLTRLINNVLDYSKIERGQKVYQLEPAPLAPVVRRAVRTMQYPLQRLGFGLRVTVADDGPPVRIDADAIEQAVLNLLSNAMKYSNGRREIDLTLAGVNGHAVITVTDYGLGIPVPEQGRIFDRFYRANVPENARIAGAGLGLALVDHIAKAHGGLVELRSAPGEGSTFAIHLPVADLGVGGDEVRA